MRADDCDLTRCAMLISVNGYCITCGQRGTLIMNCFTHLRAASMETYITIMDLANWAPVL